MGSEIRDAVASYVGFQLSELEAGMSLIAAADQEAVHSARLALRRLRSVMSCYQPLLPDVPRGLRDGIRSLARALGEARDAYVLAQRFTLWLDAYADWLSGAALHQAVAELVASSNTMAATVGRDARNDDLLAAARAALLPLPSTKPQPGPEDATRLLQQQWRKVQERLGAAMSTKVNTEEHHELLHAARKDVKGLRYAAEAVAEALGPRAAAIVQPAMALQRILGEHHDSVAGLAWLAGLTPTINPADIEQLRAMESRRLGEAQAGLHRLLRDAPIPAPVDVLSPHVPLADAPAPAV